MIDFTIEEKCLLQRYDTLSKIETIHALNKRLRGLGHYDYDKRALIESVMDKLDLLSEDEYDELDLDFDFYDPDYDPSRM